MNKFNAGISIICLFAGLGCSLISSSNKAKSTPTPSPASNISSEKTIATTNVNNNKQTGNSSSTQDQTLDELEEIVKNDTKNYQAYFQIGKKNQALKSEDKAISAYKSAIGIKPDYAEANYELGKIYFNKKDFETSLPFLQQAAKTNDKSPLYLIALGDNFRELKRCNFAMPPYGNSINFDDKNPAAYYGMGLCYLELKNRIAAEQQIRPLEKLDKNLAQQLQKKIAAQ